MGFAGARRKDGRLSWQTAALWGALALLPDLDVIGLRLGVAYGDPLGHRGASHSLAAALCVASLAAVLCLGVRKRGIARTWFWWVLAVVASHGLLDTLTDGGKGVALLWPFTTHRYFAPFRPIPVAPIGAAMASGRGLRVALTEAVIFAPLFAYAFWPRRLASARDQAGSKAA